MQYLFVSPVRLRVAGVDRFLVACSDNIWVRKWMIYEYEKIFLEIDKTTAELSQFIKDGLDEFRAEELKQKVRAATELFYRSNDVIRNAKVPKDYAFKFLRLSTELISLQSRLIRTCHLATMVIIYFNSGKMDFIGRPTKTTPEAPQIQKLR